MFLEDIADKLEETMEYWEQYLNVETGEFAALSDGDKNCRRNPAGKSAG